MRSCSIRGKQGDSPVYSGVILRIDRLIMQVMWWKSLRWGSLNEYGTVFLLRMKAKPEMINFKSRQFGVIT